MSAPEKGTDAYAIWAAIHLGIQTENDLNEMDDVHPVEGVIRRGQLGDEQIEWLAYWLAGEGIGKLSDYR